jgi:ABC-type Na+ efflux pump permease subunit
VLDKLKQKGTKVKVTATVPGAGTVKAGSPSDPSLARVSAVAKKSLKPVSQTVTSTSTQQVVLTLKLTKSAKRKLASKGKLKVKVKVIYTPSGGPSGSQTKTVKLVKKLGAALRVAADAVSVSVEVTRVGRQDLEVATGDVALRP